MSTERRFCELRADGRTLSGTAIRYGDVARLPWGEERFQAGAFGPDVAAADVILNNGHDRRRPVARTGGGGLMLLNEAAALKVHADMPDVAEANEVLKLVRARILRGFSIEFVADAERIEADVRVIEAATLTGIAVVDRPAYTESQIAARWKGQFHARSASGLPGSPAQRREADRRRAWL